MSEPTDTTPAATHKGITFWPIPHVSDEHVAFGMPGSAYFPRHDLPDVPQRFEDEARRLFFRGGKMSDLHPAVDRLLAARWLQAHFRSFAPSHEAKEATVAYAIWVWNTAEIVQPAMKGGAA